MAEYLRRCKLKGCDKDFVTRRTWQKYCSTEHREVFNNRKVKGQIERRDKAIEKLRARRLPIDASNRSMWAHELAKDVVATIKEAGQLSDEYKTVTIAILIRKRLGWK